MRPSLLAAAVLSAVAVFSGCAASTPPMPSLHGDHIDVPAIPLPSATNVVLDSATVDAAGAAECVALRSGASSPVFFDDDLGAWSVSQLATVGGDLDRQRKLLGNLFVSGYFGGMDLQANDGAEVDIPSSSPFAALQGLVNSTTSIPVLDQIAGRVLLVANGNASEVGTSVGLLPAQLVRIIAAAQQTLAQPDVPEDGAALLHALIDAAGSILGAATAGMSGDLAAARRAEQATAGLITWAAGYYLGLTAQQPIADPTLSC